MSDAISRLNAALKGRYRIERELGEGGMATVYLARDERHNRNVALKVLKPELAAVVGAERFLAEIETTASLQHPHILPLFDSGEADGFLFYVMPFVEGESLKRRLTREHELPVEEALRIGREAASALAYAHSAGIVHRDIKPANILVSSGQAIVADFGIARATELAADPGLTGTSASAGTPLYMSPEQLIGDHVVAAPTDIYALGCVVYEMLTGQPPHEGRTAQAIAARRITQDVAPIRDTRATVPESVDRAVQRALSKLPADRFASAEEFAAALDCRVVTGDLMRPARTGRQRTWAWSGAATVLVAGFATVLLLTRPAESLEFHGRDWVIIADVENHTGDDIFDRSLHTALSVALDQSMHVNVYPVQRVRETLRRMGVDSVTAFPLHLAREVAIRENLKAVLALEVDNVDDVYTLTVRVLAAESGASAYSETARANGRNEVLEALDKLALGVRSNLGESLASIEERSVRLPDATTSSLDALKRYADGKNAWGTSHYQEARTLLKEAVELDSMFALAHVALGVAADWLDGAPSGKLHYDRALALQNRVTQKERLWIRAQADPGQAGMEALEVYTQLYPDDRDAWYNLGSKYRQFGRWDDAADAYARSIVSDSLFSWAYFGSALAFDQLDRHEEAVAAVTKAFELDPSLRTQVAGDLNRVAGFVLVRAGDTVRARELFELMASDPGTDERANGLRSLALLDMYRGRMESAIDRFEEAVTLTAGLDEYRNRLYLASALEAKGMLPRARAEWEEAARLAQEIRPGPVWLSILVTSLARDGAADRAADVLALWQGSEDEASPYDWAHLERSRGEIALARADVQTSRVAFDRAYGLVRDADQLEAVAYGHLMAGRLDEARAAFESLLAQRPLGWEAQALWLTAHVRLARVREELGDRDAAADLYRQLISLWSDGDPDLPLLLEARAGLDALAN